MAHRIRDMRALLHAELKALGTPGSWQHLEQQIGMFSYTGLTVKQCERMMKEHHVYLTSNGRISMAGVNKGNVAYVAKAIDDCVRNA